MSLENIKAGLPAMHGFFTRQGGISTGPFASLNCSFSHPSERRNALQNRAWVAAEMLLAPESLLGLKQVHGTEVVNVTQRWPVGGGPEADAMVTAIPRLGLGIISADCAPVLFSDSAGMVVGAAHAGWRGAVAGVLEATVAAMRNLTLLPITAAIGPCIHQQSYEVGPDLRDAVLAHDPNNARFFEPGQRPEKWQFDLPGYCASRLEAINVSATILPHDTCADEEKFFSHRRRTLRGEPAIGHQISVIRIAG